MNVLFFSSYSSPYISGMTVYVKRVIIYLKKRKANVTHLFFYPKNYSSKDSQSIPFFVQLYKGFISFQAPLIFWNAVKNQDVVCVNYPNVEAIPLIICAVIQRKKIVTIFHCTVQISNPVLSVFLTPLLYISLYIHLFASGSIIAQEDYILSYWWSGFFKKKFVYADPPINIFREPKKLMKKIPNSIGFIGRISEEKGIEYLIDALYELKHMSLYFIGPSFVQGESSYKNKILQLLKQKKVSYHLILDPTDKKLSDYLSQLEMIVLPSINNTEAYGMVQPEAMCRGTAVIATELPGVRVPIQKTHMGLLVPPKNTRALVMAINTIHQDLQRFTNQKLIHKAHLQFEPTKTLEIIYNALTVIKI